MSVSYFPHSHTSDVLRFLTLWKCGRIYMDLDVIVTKPLEDLGNDFAGVESNTSVAVGILGFNYTGVGHEYASSCLEDLKDNFRGYDWGWNGPDTITRLLKNVCKMDSVYNMAGKTCKGFKIYSRYEFYAISPWNWRWFFEPEYLEQILAFTDNSHVIHVWNKLSASTRIPVKAKGIPYLEFAKKYCPNIVRECEEYF